MCFSVKWNGLVTRIETCQITLAAVNTKIVIDDRELLFFWHMINIFKMMVSCSSDIFQSRDFFDIYLLWFFTIFPERKVIYVWFQSLTLLDRWTLSFPSFLLKIFSFGQVKCCFESSIEILNDSKVLLLNGGSNLENWTTSELSIRKSMMRINYSTSCHQFSFIKMGVISDISGNSKSNRSKNRSTGSSKECLFLRSYSGIRL